MADEDRGYPTRQETQRDDVLTTVTAAIMSRFSDLQSELSAMRKLLGQAEKADAKHKFSGSSFGDLVSDLKSATKTVENFDKKVKSLSKQLESEQDRWNSQNKSYSGKTGVEKVYVKRRAEDIEKYQKILDSLSKDKEKELAENEKISKLLDDTIKLGFKINETSDQQLKDMYEKEKKAKEDAIDEETSVIENKYEQLFNDLKTKLRETLDSLDEEHEKALRAVEDAYSSMSSLKGVSAYGASMKSEEDLETPEDKIAKVIAKQVDTNEKAMKAILKLMESATDEDKKVYQKQYDYLEKQTKNLKEWTPAREQFSKSVKTLGDAAKNMLSTLGKSVLKNFKDYYLDSYKESFQKVYDSIENTRNTVSARSKLDQGGFSDLQAQIQSEIETLGIEASVTQADVNDALVSLSAAGITDKDMLKTLAIEQAKLIASGSSVNLGNEETLQNLMQIYQQQLQETHGDQQKALDKLSSLIQTAGTAQSAVGAVYGSDASLVNGGADRELNQVLSLGISAGKSIEQMSSDIQSAFATSEFMYRSGQDQDVLNSIINDIVNKPVSDYSKLEKILLTSNKLSRDALLDSNASLEQNYQDIYSAMKDILQSGTEGDKKYLAEILNAYGFNMESLEASKFMNAPDEIRMISDAEKEQAEATDKQAREQGTFLSTTQKHLNEAQNTMTESAIEAEKFYRGDNYISAGFDAVNTGLSAIADVAKSILTSMWTNSGLGKTFNSEGMESFMTGKSGTTAGAIGKGASVAVGAGMMGVSGYNIISSGIESGQAGLDTAYDLFTDTKFQAGLGTTIGGAMGGPVGAAVGSAIFGTFSKLGNWLGSTDEGLKIFADVMPLLPEIEDSAQVLAKEMTADANENILAAQKQIEASDEMLAKFEKMTDDQKKLELIKIGELDAQKAATIKTEDLNKLFEENIVADAKRVKGEAELLRAEQEMKLNSAIQFASVNEAFGESGLGGNAIDAMKKFAGMVGGKEAAADVFTSIESEISGMDDAGLKAYLQGYNGLTADDLGNKDTDELRSLASKKKASNLGFTGGALEVVDFAYSEWSKRKQRYDEANTKFISNWKKIDTGGDIWSSIAAYEDAYLKDASPDELRAFGEGVASVFASTGKVQLPTYKGNYYLDNYLEGHQFKTGLTEVPSDNYLALLHKGERILTREEAKAYNEMSSFAVSNLINTFNGNNSSSSVFSTTSYGVDIDKSIGTQTDVISKKLDQVISAIEKLNISLGNTSRTSSASYKNVVRGNSNITQLNTL